MIGKLGLYPNDPCYDTGRATGAKSLLPYWIDTDAEHYCLVQTGRSQPDIFDSWINAWAYGGTPDFPDGVYPAPGVPAGVLTDPSGAITQDDINAGNRAAHDAWIARLRNLMQEDPAMDRGNWAIVAIGLAALVFVAVKLK